MHASGCICQLGASTQLAQTSYHSPPAPGCRYRAQWHAVNIFILRAFFRLQNAHLCSCSLVVCLRGCGATELLYCRCFM